MKNILKIFSLLVVLTVTSCSNSDDIDFKFTDYPTTSEFNQTKQDYIVSNTMDQVGYQIFNKLAKDENINNNNFAFSPLSFALGMGLLANTTSDDRAEKICNLYKANSLDDLNSICRKLMMFLPDASNQAALYLANSIWYDHNASLKESYRENITNNFFATIQPLDFESENAGKIINQWGCNKTKGMIPWFLGENTKSMPDTKLIYANALYFASEWSHKFDKADTKREIFHGINGDTDVDMMHAYELDGAYTETPDYIKISLPFKGKYIIDIVLPPKSDDFFEFASNYNPYADNYDKSRYPAIFNLGLPKFTAELQQYAFNKILKDLDVDIYDNYDRYLEGAFSDNSITQKSIIAQSAKIEIDEEGAKAAAVTSEVMYGDSDLPIEKDITIDRPFIFVLINNVTYSVIMIGQCVQP